MSKNYGAVLQAYAMRKMLEKLGLQAEIIQYNGEIGDNTYRTFAKVTSPGLLRYNAKRFAHWRDIEESTEKFQNFRQTYFHLTRKYSSLEELREDAPKADFYVVGSDQVWNPSILYSPIYFLDFGTPQTKRIAYAASFGKEDYPEAYFKETESLLRGLDGISVREQHALGILQKLHMSGEVVLDPTLMLETEDWDAIAKRPRQLSDEPYVLCYFLNMNDMVKALVDEIHQRTGYKVINIATNVWNPVIGDEQRWDIGPEEFVWLVHHAQFVCTSSFHGTVFSLIYGRPFLTINIHKNDSRLTDLLESFHLERHLAQSPDFDVEPLLQEGESYSRSQIQTMKDTSLAFLKRALNV
jgi:hypothetical protein